MHLRRQISRILDGTALKGFTDLVHFYPASFAIDPHFDTCGHDGILFRPAGQPHTDFRGNLLSPRRPPKVFGDRLKHSPNTRILKVGESERQRIRPRRNGKLVHKGLPGKVVSRGAETPVGTLAQGRIGTD